MNQQEESSAQNAEEADEAARRDRMLEERRKAEEKAAAERAKEEAYREQGRGDLADKAAERAENAEVKASCTVAPVITPNIPQNSRGTFCTTKRFAGRIKRVKLLLEYFAAHEEAFPANAKAELEKWLSAQARAAKSTNCPYQCRVLRVYERNNENKYTFNSIRDVLMPRNPESGRPACTSK